MKTKKNNSRLAQVRKGIDANMDTWLRLSKEVDQLQNKLVELVREEKQIIADELQAEVDREDMLIAKNGK